MITKEQAIKALDESMEAAKIAEEALAAGAAVDDPRVLEAKVKIREANDALLEYALQDEVVEPQARGSRFGRRGKSRHVF